MYNLTMPMKKSKTLLPAIALFALLPALSFGASKIVRSIEQTIDLDGISKIIVSVQGGYINIEGEDRPDAHLVVEQVFQRASESEADDMEEDIEQTIETRGDVLYIEFKYDRSNSVWSFFRKKPTVNFNVVIATARSVDVDLNTSGGHIEVTGIDGEVEAQTSGGHLEFQEINGPVHAHTSGGSVEASDINGDVDLSTSGGRVSVEAIAGQSKLRTSGGGIWANGLNGPLDAKTSGGGITASFPRGIDADTRLKTSGGSITAKLPRNESFYLSAHTSGGGVRTEFPITMKGELKRSHAEGKVNGGGPTLELHTSGGSISVRHL